MFLVFLEQIQEVADVFDEIPRVHISDPFYESKYLHKHVQAFHRHFEKVAEATLRLFQRQPFERLIIGGLWETLPQFESHLHHYVRGRVAARWQIDVRTPTPQILGRTIEEEQQLLLRQAEGIWSTIQDQPPRKGALGLEPVFERYGTATCRRCSLPPECHAADFAARSAAACNWPTVCAASATARRSNSPTSMRKPATRPSSSPPRSVTGRISVVKGCDSIAALKRFDRLREP